MQPTCPLSIEWPPRNTSRCSLRMFPLIGTRVRGPALLGVPGRARPRWGRLRPRHTPRISHAHRRSIVLEVVQEAIQAARTAGAGYADARVVSEETESLSVKNQEME